MLIGEESTCLFQHNIFKTYFFFTWLSRDTSMKRQTVFQANAQCLARCKKISINANYSPTLKKKNKSTSNYQDDDAHLLMHKRIKPPLTELQLWIQLKSTADIYKTTVELCYFCEASGVQAETTGT